MSREGDEVDEVLVMMVVLSLANHRLTHQVKTSYQDESAAEIQRERYGVDPLVDWITCKDKALH